MIKKKHQSIPSQVSKLPSIPPFVSSQASIFLSIYSQPSKHHRWGHQTMLHQQLFKEFSSTFHLPCHQRRENTKVTPPPAWHHYRKHFNGNHGSGHPPTKWPYQVTVPSLILLRLKEKNTFYLEVPWWSLTPNFSQPNKKNTTKTALRTLIIIKKNLPNLHTFLGGVSFWTQPFRSKPGGLDLGSLLRWRGQDAQQHKEPSSR